MMKRDIDTPTLEKEIAVLQKQTSLRFTIIATLFFLFFGTFCELFFSALIDKIPLQRAFQAFRWSKLLFMGGFFLLFFYFIILSKNKKLLQQKKMELQNRLL